MLVYHPAFDANHCAYRFLHILYCSKAEKIEWDKLRLADFYYLFPHLLKLIKPLPKAISKGRKYFVKIPDPYENVPNPKRLMFDLRDIQNSTIASLVAKNIVNKESFHKGEVSLVIESLPKALIESFDDNPISHEDWFKLFSKEIPFIELLGSKGFKARSKLMEYRYDK